MPETAVKCKSNPYIFGRPGKYCPIICRCLVQYFDQDPVKTKKIDHYDKEGNVSWTDQKETPNRVPSLTKFAKLFSIGWTTIHEWIDPNQPNYQPDFANAYTYARAIRKDFLIDSAIQGQTAPNTFKFIATNLTDMRDKQEVEHNVKDSIAGLIQAAAAEKAREVKQITSNVIQNPLNAINNAENDTSVAVVSETVGNGEHTQ